MIRIRKSRVIWCFSLILLLISNSIYATDSKGKERDGVFAYVVCEDKRLYIIDLSNNEVILRSGILSELGRPTSIAIGTKQKRLFIANELGSGQLKYSPIVVFDINTSQVRTMGQFDLIVDRRFGAFGGVSAVYEVVVSPDGKRLYLGYSHPNYARGTTVVNSETGEIVGMLDFIITANSIFSPDGKQVAEIWPGGNKSVENDGRMSLKKWSAGVAVYDIEQNKMISRKEVEKDKVGLFPPWNKIEGPLLYITNNKMLTAVDRDRGTPIYEIDLSNISQGLAVFTRYPLTIGNGEKAIVTMVSKDGKWYVAVVDLRKKEVVGNIRIGANPTNIVLSNFAPK